MPESLGEGNFIKSALDEKAKVDGKPYGYIIAHSGMEQLRYDMLVANQAQMIVSLDDEDWEEYVPDVKGRYDGFTVTHLSDLKEKKGKHLLIRHFKVTKGKKEVLRFKHFHFLSWPDMGLPTKGSMIVLQNLVKDLA